MNRTAVQSGSVSVFFRFDEPDLQTLGVMKGIKMEIANGFWEIQDLLDKTWEEEDEESEDDEEEIDEEEVVGMMDDLENIRVENSDPVGTSA
jgi:hypothetical protein